jgi:hypothetical protein
MFKYHLLQTVKLKGINSYHKGAIAMDILPKNKDKEGSEDRIKS